MQQLVPNALCPKLHQLGRPYNLYPPVFTLTLAGRFAAIPGPVFRAR